MNANQTFNCKCLEAGVARRFNNRYASFESRLETAGNARL
jgi:hypothetical protein